jgi:hypothetical protein
MAWVALSIASGAVLLSGRSDLTTGPVLSDPQACVRTAQWFIEVLQLVGRTAMPVVVAVEGPGIQVPRVGHTLFAVACSVLATATSFNVPVMWIHPTSWKAAVGLPIGQHQSRVIKKNRALELARAEWPSCPSHDCADAYLIAFYVRQRGARLYKV